MNTKNLLSWLALILGAAIIIGAFFIFAKDAPCDLFVLNLSVSLLIYALFFVDVLVPWVNWSDRSKNRIGSIGLRWFVTWIYAILAIAAMLLCNKVYDVEFPVQLIVHGSLLLILILGFSAVLHASDKVTSVYVKEETMQFGVTEMRRAMSELKDVMCGLPDIPDAIRDRVMRLEEDLRYISPSNNPEAADMEQRFSLAIREVCHKIGGNTGNTDLIVVSLDKAAYILKNRKSIYSL